MSASSTRLSTPSGTPRTTTDSAASHPAHRLLSCAHPHDSETASRIFTDKILHKPLLLSSSDHSDKRVARRHIRERKKAYARKHARPKPLSAKEKRKLHLYELRPEDCRYEVYQGLNRLWSRYMLEVLGYLDRQGDVMQSRVGTAVTANSAGSLIASADFHGMEVEVVRSADGGRVGMKGIVVRETRSTLTIVMNEREDKPRKKIRLNKNEHEQVAGDEEQHRQHDKVRMILKKGSVFRVVIELPLQSETSADTLGMTRQLVFDLHGDQLEIRPIERATKKFKWKTMDYL